MASKRGNTTFCFEGSACETKDCIMNYTDISERIFYPDAGDPRNTGDERTILGPERSDTGGSRRSRQRVRSAYCRSKGRVVEDDEDASAKSDDALATGQESVDMTSYETQSKLISFLCRVLKDIQAAT